MTSSAAGSGATRASSRADGSGAQAQRSQLRTPRVADAVAGELRLRIIEGDLDGGSELPTEAALLEDFPVSRPSLREAFRILETEGLVKVRRGKRGGTLVTGPTSDAAAYHMGLLIHSRATPMTDLAAARKMLEPLCAEQAARREDHRRVGTALRKLVEASLEVAEDSNAFTREATKFHEALVDAAGNETLRVITGMLESVWSVQEQGWAREATDEEQYPELRLRKSAIKAHLAICEAVIRGDAETAGRLTASHLDASQLYVATDETRLVKVLDDFGNSRMSHGR